MTDLIKSAKSFTWQYGLHVFSSYTSKLLSKYKSFTNWLIVKSKRILGENPNAVANLRIVGLDVVLFLKLKIYCSAFTFDFAYKDRGSNL